MNHAARQLSLVVLLAAMPLLGGCLLAAAGAGAAVAWSALGEDAVIAPVERPYEEVWPAMRRVLENWSGDDVQTLDRDGYFMATEYDGTEVEVRFRLEPPLTKVAIKARKGYGTIPARDIAGDLADALYTELATGG